MSGGLRYRIVRRLGQGGMAEVFEAEVSGALGFARKVAIKRLLVDAAEDTAARRFLDEARIASRLHHGNIVAVLDVGLLDGLPFQVLELVDGTNAHQLMRRAGGTLPHEIALVIANDVAHALDHAHRATDEHGMPLGIVHRDVKPSNILVGSAGDVKLADFGIAIAHERDARTETGVVAGTRGFIAPEQRTRSEVDGRSDVFALGVTLHAMLAGYTPLQDVTVEMAVLAGQAMPLDPSIPEDVRRLIASAVAPRRLDRPTARELATLIGAALAPRLSIDPRSLIRKFLESHEAATPRPTAGSLDQFLGVGVELLEADGDVKLFRTVAAPSPQEEQATKLARPSPRSRPSARTLLTKSSPRWLRPFAIAAVLVVAGALAMLLWPPEPTRSEPVATITSDAAPVVVSPDAEPAPTPDAMEPPTPRDAGAPTPKLPTTPRRRVETIDKRPEHKPALAPVVLGWIQVVGGESLVGARVLVDGGKYSGSVPNKIEVPLGRHLVEVVPRDGTKLAAKPVEVTSFHTLSRPARLTWN